MPSFLPQYPFAPNPLLLSGRLLLAGAHGLILFERGGRAGFAYPTRIVYLKREPAGQPA